MRNITRIAAAVFAAAAIALGALGAAGPDMHYHGPPVADGGMYHHA